ncbi:MMPL family transporter [Pseudenhygromyxa sp. WMMC2535]|uniref:MMPL family transporter n=1 Tax=Pseudenhygromyxa sp. WMMC2535 TaxID=2712867 RepID=UPI0015956E0F|nr:MMPL family transporter [Pseudenhygromyxa sp. WMMC2535]NVB43570.1 MMPL family transporter [Pseudenhygromyxa sp. WMMC2535]
MLIPLMCGVAWSLGATYLALGHLNAITSMISSVVMGIGIDAGIHILARTRREREFHDSHDSIRLAFKGLIAPLLIASGTTASAFVVMANSTFPAFSEFGVIAFLASACACWQWSPCSRRCSHASASRRPSACRPAASARPRGCSSPGRG